MEKFLKENWVFITLLLALGVYFYLKENKALPAVLGGNTGGNDNTDINDNSINEGIQSVNAGASPANGKYPVYDKTGGVIVFYTNQESTKTGGVINPVLEKGKIVYFVLNPNYV